jgi:hypothetical protein
MKNQTRVRRKYRKNQPVLQGQTLSAIGPTGQGSDAVVSFAGLEPELAAIAGDWGRERRLECANKLERWVGQLRASSDECNLNPLEMFVKTLTDMSEQEFNSLNPLDPKPVVMRYAIPVARDKPRKLRSRRTRHWLNVRLHETWIDELRGLAECAGVVLNRFLTSKMIEAKCDLEKYIGLRGKTAVMLTPLQRMYMGANCARVVHAVRPSEEVQARN